MADARKRGSDSGAEEGSEESVGTVIVAGVANLGIAVAKLAGALISGSSAMLAEAAHSVADTATEVLLLTALRRSRLPADERHPQGHSRERYVWALLASVATFVGGAVFSVFDGIRALMQPGEDNGSPLVAYLVLVVAFVMEGSSLLRGVRQVRRESRELGMRPRRYFRWTPDTTVKAVVLEDSAALVGLLLAAGGLFGRQLTGSGAWDAVASMLIGLLLASVAYVLGRDNASLLIGRALPDRAEAAIRRELEALPQIAAVVDLTTLIQGPQDVVVFAHVDFTDAATSQEIEAAGDEAEQRLRSRFPWVSVVSLDPTAASREP
jgi:cation diffusion facilitator family transporter